jgi:hypothetical protein
VRRPLDAHSAYRASAPTSNPRPSTCLMPFEDAGWVHRLGLAGCGLAWSRSCLSVMLVPSGNVTCQKSMPSMRLPVTARAASSGLGTRHFLLSTTNEHELRG